MRMQRALKALGRWGGACVAAQALAGPSLPNGTFEVKPVVRDAARGAPGLSLAATPYFAYALPPGWRVGESGQFALTLVAPDNRALTIMVGNSGLPLNYPPGQYVYERLMALQPQALQLGQPRAVRPIQGFAQAYEFAVRYMVNGVACQGVATLHIAPAYDSAVMAMTAALSEQRQWSDYAHWLPLVAAQVSARNGAAFGMRGVMAQNLQNSTEYARAAQEYRSWSQRNWQGVTDQRNASQDRNQQQFRETLGGVQTYADPRDAGRQIELPNSHKYFWMNEQGTIVGTDDPGVDPNSGSTKDWRRMPRRAP